MIGSTNANSSSAALISMMETPEMEVLSMQVEEVTNIKNTIELKDFVFSKLQPEDTSVLWIDTSSKNKKMKYYNGTEWIEIERNSITFQIEL